MSEKKSYIELITKAQKYLFNQQWQNALEMYNQAIDQYPDDIDLYFRRSLVKIELEDFNSALDDYDKILAIDPDNYRAFLQKGYIWGFRLSNIEKAIECLNNVPQGDALNPAACLYKGIFNYNAKDYAMAEVEYTNALKGDSGFGAVYFYRALLFENTGAYLKAMEDYQAAIKHGFNFRHVYYALGLSYARFGNFDMAEKELQLAHSKKPYSSTRTMDFPCNYFHDKRPAATEDIFPDTSQIENFSDYLEQGFVRSGNHYFRHNCPGCKSCVPLRVIADKFMYTKSIKRTIKKNNDLKMSILEKPVIDPVRAKLFEKYFREKHNKTDRDSPEQEIAFRHLGFKYSHELDFYLDDKLVAVHIVDIGDDALYAAYLYYDTDYMNRRLGVYSIAKGIEYAAQLDKSFYYMGWYIEGLPVMSYKKQFRPNQLLSGGQWNDFC